MLIEEGERFRDLAREELPETPPAEEHQPLSVVPAMPSPLDDRQKLLLALIGLAVGIGLTVLLVVWFRWMLSTRNVE